MGDSRPPFPPAPIRFFLLAGAILTVLLSGLFLARPAGAATLTPVSPAAHPASHTQSAPAAPAASVARTATTGRATTMHAATIAPAKLDSLVRPDGGVCSVPGIGDIGGLLGLCNGGSSGVVGELNNICTPSVPQPEQATSGVDSMIATPGGQTGGKTLYDNYGLAGQFWGAYGLHCSDMTSLIGNNVAGMVFDMAKSLDRVTITVYQTAAGNGILTWLQTAVDKLIRALGKAIYFPFLAPVVIIGAIWLAWQGLIRKRATRTIEGTLWMVIACAAAIWLIGRPADFTGLGGTVSNSVTQVMNVAFAKLPAPTGSNCLPVGSTDPQSVTANYAFTSANGLVDQNANELWAVLVCKPWLDGELGTTQYGKTPPNVVDAYGRELLWAQAIAANEQPTAGVIQAKQQVYVGLAKALQSNDPAVYPLFQGNQWTTRLEIGFEALFASVAAGLLVLLIALTLIVLKLGFLLLLVAGPFFLIVGIHPGFGRVIAIRWFEMLVGVLMKQIAVALVLSVLLYCYSLIMGTTDAALPWALKIMMIALVTVAVFIYRRPFQHLFSSVGYGVLGSTERAEYSWREATFGFRRATATAAGGVTGFGAYRAARWARRSPGAATAVGAGGGTGAAAMAGATGEDAAAGASPGAASGAPGAPALGGVPAADAHTTGRLRPDGPPPGGDGDGSSGPGGSGGSGGSGRSGGGRGRQWPEAGGGAGRSAPPLPLRPPGGGSSPEGGSAGWARGSAARAGTTAGRSAGSAPPPAPAGNGQRGANSGGAGSPTPPPVRQSARSAGHGSSGGAQARSAPAGGAPAGSGPWAGRSAGGRGSSAGHAAGGRSAGSAPAAGGSPGNGSGTAPGNGAAGGGSGRTSRTASGNGWPGAGATVRSGEADGTGAAGKRQPLPFWLRPVRRDK